MLKAVELLEVALWKGEGYPTLHEAVSQAVFQVRKSQRFRLERHTVQLPVCCVAGEAQAFKGTIS